MGSGSTRESQKNVLGVTEKNTEAVKSRKKNSKLGSQPQCQVRVGLSVRCPYKLFFEHLLPTWHGCIIQLRNLQKTRPTWDKVAARMYGTQETGLVYSVALLPT